jgi:hypothetical protein
MAFLVVLVLYWFVTTPRVRVPFLVLLALPLLSIAHRTALSL